MRLPTGRIHPRAIAGSKAKKGDALIWNGTEYGPGTPHVGASLWVGPSAPTDGSVFWYDTDATC